MIIIFKMCPFSQRIYTGKKHFYTLYNLLYYIFYLIYVQYNNIFYQNQITKNTIGTVIKIQMAWLTGWQVIW